MNEEQRKVIGKVFELWWEDRECFIHNHCASDEEIEETEKEFEDMKERVYKAFDKE